MDTINNGLKNGMDLFKNVLNSLDTLGNNMIIFVALFILFCVCSYLLVSYIIMGNQINKLLDYTLHVDSLGKIYTADVYDPEVFKKLLLDALNELRSNLKIVSTPYFYAKSLDDILNVFPRYTIVLRFAKYCSDHKDTRNDAVHKVMLEQYGKNYLKSSELVYDVTVPVTVNHSTTYKHSLLIDLTKSQYIYKKNKSRVDLILGQTKITQENKL